MPAGTPIALTTVRVAHGEPRPSEEAFRLAIVRDRQALCLPLASRPPEVQIAGPYRILVGGEDLDEYVVWEQ